MCRCNFVDIRSFFVKHHAHGEVHLAQGLLQGVEIRFGLAIWLDHPLSHAAAMQLLHNTDGRDV